VNKDKPRLIEVAFPLKQASLDSVHEKNVRHGHISTLHIWPARRPLAACRAALIATLLPDPDTDLERKTLLERIAGVVKQENTFKTVGDRKIPVIKEFTDGGILHWGRENGPDLQYFREEILKAFGGRAPRVLDPFAGGGAIPLEAMRLGCDVSASDINPVAWFILKCTLDYPQRLAGKTRPLPSFSLRSPDFMQEFLKGTSKGIKASLRNSEETQGTMLVPPDADFSWHIRSWGNWVLECASKDLKKFYPTIDGKPTVAYLWARTVTCKNCRATIPLLKTLWLCRNAKKRVRLQIKPRHDHSGVDFEIVNEPMVGGNAGQRRSHDLEVGKGTMGGSGARCPICGSPDTIAMTKDDIKSDMLAQHKAGYTREQMTAVVVDGPNGKEYRLPTSDELQAANNAGSYLKEVFKDIPFGLPIEPIIEDAKGSTWCVQYGYDQWYKLFTPRQLVTLGTFLKYIRIARDIMRDEKYPPEWIEAISGYLALSLDRVADRGSTLCTWTVGWDKIGHTFVRFALPLTWDFVESVPIESSTGGYPGAIEWVARYSSYATGSFLLANTTSILAQSALTLNLQQLDLIITDPPYYDAIPYSNTMDFFYVWLRRTLYGLSADIDKVFNESLCPKWNTAKNDGELVDDASRFGGDKKKSKDNYEDGMFRCFRSCYDSLNMNGHLVIVFANKQFDAWETLASSVIRAGFVIDGSWPIQTEMANRTRALSSSALSSSVWLVCRKREETTRPGWDNRVLEEMRENIEKHLPRFWDAGIRGPDFIWAATGPALEAYSKYPAVKKADQPDSLITVSEFLGHVRRMVVDYVVGRILSANGETAESLDDLTIYYLLHRQSFGMEEAPVGAVILYAQSCNLRDRDLIDRFDILSHGKSKVEAEEAEETEDGEDIREEQGTSGSTAKLKRWDSRKHKDLGLDALGNKSPLIDRVHHIMQLWRIGDVQKVDNYIEETGLRRSEVFPKLVQSLIELARKDEQADEVALLESIMNHITARGMHPQMRLIPNEDNP
jgi:putative DNA methylase